MHCATVTTVKSHGSFKIALGLLVRCSEPSGHFSKKLVKKPTKNNVVIRFNAVLLVTPGLVLCFHCEFFELKL